MYVNAYNRRFWGIILLAGITHRKDIGYAH